MSIKNTDPFVKFYICFFGVVLFGVAIGNYLEKQRETETIKSYACNPSVSLSQKRYIRGEDQGKLKCDLYDRSIDSSDYADRYIFAQDSCAFKIAWCDKQREISGIIAAKQNMRKVQEDLDRAAAAAKKLDAKRTEEALQDAVESTKTLWDGALPVAFRFITQAFTNVLSTILGKH